MAEKSLYNTIKLTKKSRSSANTFERAYKGFSTVNLDNSSYNLYDLAIIKQDIINHFHIRKGEKLSNPNFGTIIWDVLFEPLTQDLKNAIIDDVNAILANDPRVVPQQVLVTEYENGIQLECTLTYLPYNITESLRFTFDQNNGLL
jgi:phage baseplate assembly protein W|tara:strand:+ start:9026 stop:9463 length:438 start_codon:yes stop_codon:yes gene_type:complete